MNRWSTEVLFFGLGVGWKGEISGFVEPIDT